MYCFIRIQYVHEFWQTIHSVPPLCCSAPSTTKVLWIGKLVDFFSHRYVHKSLDSSSNRHLFYRRTTTPGLGSFFSFFSTAADNTLWLVWPYVKICWEPIKEYQKFRSVYTVGNVFPLDDRLLDFSLEMITQLIYGSKSPLSKWIAGFTETLLQFCVLTIHTLDGSTCNLNKQSKNWIHEYYQTSKFEKVFFTLLTNLYPLVSSYLDELSIWVFLNTTLWIWLFIV